MRIAQLIAACVAAATAAGCSTADSQSAETQKEQTCKSRPHKPKRSGLRYLFIGDSITDGGWGNSCGDMRPSAERNQTDMNHIYGHSYMMLCAAEMQGASPDSNITCMNRGISGNTLEMVAARWQEDAVALKPDVLTMLVGTNEVELFVNDSTANPLDTAAWSARYRGLLNDIREDNPDVEIVLGTPFVAKVGWRGEMANYALREAKCDECAESVRRIAAEYDATLLDFNALFKSLISNHPNPEYWIWDGIHPTPAGHWQMANLWLNTVK